MNKQFAHLSGSPAGPSSKRFARLSEIVSKPGRPGRYPCSAASWWRWIQAGEAPAGIKLGPNTTVWDLDLLDEWDAKKAAAGQEVAA